MLEKGVVLGVAVAVVAGCSSGSGGGAFNVGGATRCGQIEPCGGDLTGTWAFTTGCVTSLGFKEAVSGAASSCSGETVAVTGVSVSGTMTFNADGTYVASALSKQGTYSLNVPASCLNGTACSTVASSLEASGEFETASCSGVAGCACTAVQTPITVTESGSYTISGSTVTMASTTGSSTVSYCVDGSTFHLLDTSTMSMGPMGQAAIDEDTIGLKQ